MVEVFGLVVAKRRDRLALVVDCRDARAVGLEPSRCYLIQNFADGVRLRLYRMEHGRDAPKCHAIRADEVVSLSVDALAAAGWRRAPQGSRVRLSPDGASVLIRHATAEPVAERPRIRDPGAEQARQAYDAAMEDRIRRGLVVVVDHGPPKGLRRKG